MMHLYKQSYTSIIRDVRGYAYSDEETANIIREVYGTSGYLMDPHGAIGYLGLKSFDLEDHEMGIFLETAHPAKFDQALKTILGTEIEIPERLAERMDMDKVAAELPASYPEFKSWLLSQS
jgi:threonine synthase